MSRLLLSLVPPLAIVLAVAFVIVPAVARFSSQLAG